MSLQALFSFLAALKSRLKRHRSASSPFKFRPGLEELENRTTSATPAHDLTTLMGIGSVQAAIESVKPEHVIRVDTGNYRESINASKQTTPESDGSGSNAKTDPGTARTPAIDVTRSGPDASRR